MEGGVQKYIPPPLRRKLAAAAAEPASTSSPSVSSYNSFNRDARGRGGPRPPPADRWKNLNDDDDRSGYGDRGYGGGGDRFGGDRYGGGDGYGDRRRNRQSRTGTGWDVRYGRIWAEEDEKKVFKCTEEKTAGINFSRYDDIPVELTGRDSETIEPMTSFKESRNVHPLLAANIDKVDYERPTPVQKYSIPALLAGRDLMACAQTGSGKTAAFLFPIITDMLTKGPPSDMCSEQTDGRYFGRGTPGRPVALIVSPTRELAIQIFEESRKFAFKTGIRTVVVYGGSCMRTQQYDIKRGVDIVVATPGRLADHLEHGTLRLSQVRHFVLDEADRMLDMGFSPQIYGIVEDYDLPKSENGRQTIMFSATFPHAIQQLASEFLRNYLFLTVGRVGSATEFVSQHLIYADEDAKAGKLLSLLKEEEGQLVIVFVDTKKKADQVENFLRRNDYQAVAIHGDKSQVERERALKLFRTGRSPILVATDVAARGLDISNISHVINCNLPSKLDDYVHRIGRTGRAGNRGKATSFVNESDRGLLRDLLGNLESSNQDVPPWFYEMVKQVTSGRNYPNNLNSYGNRNRRPAGNAFGGRDVRETAPPRRNNDFVRANHDDYFTRRQTAATAAPATAVADDDDGW